jgi:hypothetical protein
LLLLHAASSRGLFLHADIRRCAYSALGHM